MPVARTSLPLIPLLLLTLAPALQAEAPLIRVYRGFRRAEVSSRQFLEVLSSRFIPAAPEIMAPHGLVGYVPAVPPEDKPAFVPDEIAIVVYGSAEGYSSSWDDPKVQEYGRMHGELFENSRTGRTRTGTAVPFARALEADTPVDVFGTPVDWQRGFTGVFVGLRRPEVPREEFLARLTAHLVHVREQLEPLGLDGYVVSATEEYELAWMHWPSRELADEAYQTPAGIEAAADAGRILTPLMWAPAEVFAGAVDFGEATTVPVPDARGRHPQDR